MRDGSDNYKNAHGFEFVSYIYGELDHPAREAFEAHLTICDECAFELGSFSDARLGVIEWRREDFDPLETPACVVPVSDERQAAAEAETSGIFARFVEAIGSFPMFAKAGIGFAAAALAVGAVYFASSSPSNAHNVAATNTTIELNTSAPKRVEVAPPQFVTAGVEKPDPKVNKNADARPNGVHRTVTVARSNTRPTIHRTQLATATTVKDPKAAVKKAPRLTTIDEDDDKSLRLADLFAEIGSSE